MCIVYCMCIYVCLLILHDKYLENIFLQCNLDGIFLNLTAAI